MKSPALVTVVAEAPRTLPRLPSRGLIEVAKRTMAVKAPRTAYLFPGYPAGASLKSGGGGGPPGLDTALLFPGYPAGASLKSAVLRWAGGSGASALPRLPSRGLIEVPCFQLYVAP